MKLTIEGKTVKGSVGDSFYSTETGNIWTLKKGKGGAAEAKQTGHAKQCPGHAKAF